MGNLHEKIEQLQSLGVSKKLCEILEQHIEQAPEPGLMRLSPHRLAKDWGLPARPVLEAFLHGTRLGIFDMYWYIRCPDCTGPVSRSSNLAELKSEAHCDYCDIDIKANFDRHIEILFIVNPQIRAIENRPSWLNLMDYWKMYNRVLTLPLDAGESFSCQQDLPPSQYVIHTPDFSGETSLYVEPEPANKPHSLFFSFDGEKVRRTVIRHYGSGSFEMQYTNQSEQPVELTLSRLEPRPWTSAAHVISCQVFRDLFSSELIRSEESFSISNMVFVFTDIQGSTELYERAGDVQAYLLVREHFKILTTAVREHNGAVVKTIGDEIMATFTLSSDAFQAVADALAAFKELNARSNPRDAIHIKVGIHHGPCIAVTLNDRLDYFGRTINIASRIQGQAEGGDIVLSRNFHDDLVRQGLVDPNIWQCQPFCAHLRGVEQEYELVRLRPV